MSIRNLKHFLTIIIIIIIIHAFFFQIVTCLGMILLLEDKEEDEKWDQRNQHLQKMGPDSQHPPSWTWLVIKKSRYIEE